MIDIDISMATAASSPPLPRSPWRISLAEESLVLPAKNPRLFALVSLLILAHTFLFLSVALLRAHPLAAAIMDALTITTDNAAATDEVWGHGKELALLYLAYLASKLVTQEAAVLAASATRSGDLLIRCKPTKVARARPVFFAITAAFTAAALELVASAALLLALTHSTSLLLGCVLLLLCLGALLPVSIAAAAVAVDESCGVRGAWQLVASRRGEAAVLALAAGLLPVAVYPAYALALESARSNAATMIRRYGFDESVWELGVHAYAYLLPSVGVQLFSAVAATVFYHRRREERHRQALTCNVPLVAVTVKK